MVNLNIQVPSRKQPWDCLFSQLARPEPDQVENLYLVEMEVAFFFSVLNLILHRERKKDEPTTNFLH